MEYAYFSALTWIILTICGLPLVLWLFPAEMRRFALPLAPLAGYCYCVFFANYLFRLNFSGSDAYAYGLLLLPIAVLAGSALRFWKPVSDPRALFDAEPLSVLAVALFGFAVISVPFLVKDGQAISLALSNLDVAELATASRFLQEFPRDAAIGFLGQSTHFLSGANDEWFGPSAIVAVISSLLHTEPYKIQSLVMNMVAAQGATAIYLVAREGLKGTRWASLALALVYAVSPVVLYTIWQSFGGQMIGISLLLAVIFTHTRTVEAPQTVGGLAPYAVPMVLFTSGLLLTYHFMLVLILLLLACHTAVYAAAARAPGLVLRIGAFLAASMAIVTALNPYRVLSIIDKWSMVSSGSNGWFIPWLSPDILLGANAASLFVGGPFNGRRLLWLALAMALFAATLLHLWRRRGERADLIAFVFGLFVPVFALGLLFAIQERHGMVLGSYRSFKITSSFCAVTLLALTLCLRYELESRLRKAAAAVLFTVLFALALSNDAAMIRFMRTSAYVMPNSLPELKKIEDMPFIHGINIPKAENFELLWTNYFTLRKPQVYESFPYGGRIVGMLNQEFFLAGKTAPRLPDSTDDIFAVESGEYAARYDLNDRFTLYKPAPNRDVVITPGDGWWDREATHRWSGKAGQLTSVFLDSRRDNVAVRVQGRYLDLPAGAGMSVRVNGQPVEVTQSQTQLETVPVSLHAGRNVVEFTTSLVPSQLSTGDPRTLLMLWRGVLVKFVQ